MSKEGSLRLILDEMPNMELRENVESEVVRGKTKNVVLYACHADCEYGLYNQMQQHLIKLGVR